MNKLLLAASAMSAIALSAPALAGTYTVAQDQHSANVVSFTSKAPLVKFSGQSDKIQGMVMADPGNLSMVKGEFKVDLSTLDTGIGLRNEHMRNFLETSKYPFAMLKIRSLKGASKLSPNQSTKVTVLGDMSLHGVTRPISFPAQVTYLPEQDANFRPGSWLQVESEFKLKLSDYGVTLPKMILGPKVSEVVTINLDASMVAGAGGMGHGGNPCNPCAPMNPCAMK